jgi:hypothetical protein
LRSQRLRKEGKLRAARVELLRCARPECPALARDECGPWLEEVEAQQPSIVVSASDRVGRKTGAVRVLVDGDLLVPYLEGRPLDIDPGEHLVRFELHDGGVVEQRVFVNVGEKNRVLRVEFTSRAPTIAPLSSEPPRHAVMGAARSPVWGWVATGVGVLGIAGFTYFGLTGRSAESDLAHSCAPRCSDEQRQGVLRDYRIADISLVAGIVAIGIGAWLLVASSP